MIMQCGKCGAEKPHTPQTILAHEICSECRTIGCWHVLKYIRCVCKHEMAINRLDDEKHQLCEECASLGEFTVLPF